MRAFDAFGGGRDSRSMGGAAVKASLRVVVCRARRGGRRLRHRGHWVESRYVALQGSFDVILNKASGCRRPWERVCEVKPRASSPRNRLDGASEARLNIRAAGRIEISNSKLRQDCHIYYHVHDSAIMAFGKLYTREVSPSISPPSSFKHADLALSCTGQPTLYSHKSCG